MGPPVIRPYLSTVSHDSGSRATCSMKRRRSRLSLACSSAQSRIICCSLRMCCTSPWIASARLAMAAVVALPEPPSSTEWRSRSNASSDAGGQPAAAAARRADVLHRGGEPVFEIGVEAVLRLAGLQIEKAEDQRAGEPEQRRRERNAHAAERRGQAFLERVEHRVGVAADLEAVDDGADRARRSRSGPRTCRAGRGTPGGR